MHGSSGAKTRDAIVLVQQHGKPVCLKVLGKRDGATGCYIVVDRAEDMFFAVMQDAPSGRTHVITRARKIVYDAFEK